MTKRSDWVYVILLKQNKVVDIFPCQVRDNKLLIRTGKNDRWTPLFTPDSVLPVFIEIPRRFRKPKVISASAVIIQEGMEKAYEIKGESIIDPVSGQLMPLSAADIRNFISYVIGESTLYEGGRDWVRIIEFVILIVLLIMQFIILGRLP